jgi:hypothetical protein
MTPYWLIVSDASEELTVPIFNLTFVGTVSWGEEIYTAISPTQHTLSWTTLKIAAANSAETSAVNYQSVLRHMGGTRWRSRWGTALQGSIPDGIIGIFHWHNPSGRTVALGLTQPLTEMSTRNISWCKGGWCVGLATLPPSCADCLEIWDPQPPGNLRACPGM